MKELSITFTVYIAEEADKDCAERLVNVLTHAFDSLDPECLNYHLGFQTEGFTTHIHDLETLPGEDPWDTITSDWRMEVVR